MTFSQRPWRSWSSSNETRNRSVTICRGYWKAGTVSVITTHTITDTGTDTGTDMGTDMGTDTTTLTATIITMTTTMTIPTTKTEVPIMESCAAVITAIANKQG